MSDADIQRWWTNFGTTYLIAYFICGVWIVWLTLLANPDYGIIFSILTVIFWGCGLFLSEMRPVFWPVTLYIVVIAAIIATYAQLYKTSERKFLAAAENFDAAGQKFRYRNTRIQQLTEEIAGAEEKMVLLLISVEN